MYSSRRYSVQRHINNKHGRIGSAIPFVEYVVGRRSGKYSPGPVPTYAPKEKSLLDRAKEEATRVYTTRVAEKSLPPIADPRWEKDAEVLRMYLLKYLAKDLRESS